jgi:hypothetical protein
MDADKIAEITIKYKDGKTKVYRGKQVISFIEEVLDSFELADEPQPVLKYSTPTSDGSPMAFNYKIEKNKSSAELVREMQKQVAGKLMM